jgi:hypothetical protein
LFVIGPRALQKSEWDVDSAAEWLEENADWLEDQGRLLAEMGVIDVKDAQVTGSSEDVSEADVIELEASWSMSHTHALRPSVPLRYRLLTWSFSVRSGFTARFSQETPDQESLTQMSSLAKRANYCESVWFKSLAGRSSYALVMEFFNTQRALYIHYARRALIVLFNHWPAAKPISQFGESRWVKQTLRIALSLNTFPAAQLKPERHLREGPTDSWYRSALMQLIAARQQQGDSSIGSAMVSDCHYLLAQAIGSRAGKADSSATQKTINILARGTNSQVLPGERVEYPEFKTMRLTIEQDPHQSGNGLRVRVFDSASTTTLVKDLTIQPGTGLSFVCVFPLRAAS